MLGMGMKTKDVLKSDGSQSRKRTEKGRRAPENRSFKNNKEKNVKSTDSRHFSSVKTC